MIEIDGYDIDGEVGRGGFGVVYRATQLAFGRPVAIKVLHGGRSPQAVHREFAKECRAVGALRHHPNVLSVYSSGLTKDGSPYLAMELLAGGSLSDRIPLPAVAVAELGVRLADGLGVAHASGVIHRDVKPSNVLFGDNQEPVLVDFGISTIVGEATTRSSAVALSIGYTPPEILDGCRPGVAADVYALGATMFSALTGRVPFVIEGGFSSIAVLAARIATQPVEDLRPLGVPDALCRVIEKAMAKEPAERFGSMAQFRAALEPIADDATVRTPLALWGATGPTIPSVPVAPRNLTQTLRAHRTATALSAAAVVAAVAAGALLVGGSDAPHARALAGTGRPGSTPVTRVSSATNVPLSPSTTCSSRCLTTTHPPAPVATPSATRSSSTRVAPGGAVVVVGPGTVVTITRHAAAPPVAANAAPTLTALSGSSDEVTTTGTSVVAHDADGDAITMTVSGAPSWVRVSSGRGTGTATLSVSVAPPAATVTTRTSYQQAAPTRTFSFTVTAADSHHHVTRETATWTVRDTALVLENYIGKYGYEMHVDPSDVRHHFDCAYPATGAPSSTIWRQDPAPGTVLNWATANVHFWYASDTPTGTDGSPCQDVLRGY